MRTTAILSAATASCLVGALACFAIAWQSAAQPRSLTPYRPDASVLTGAPAPPPRPAGTHARRAPDAPPPRTMEMPSIGLSAGIVPVGTDPDGSVHVPDPSAVGWYRPGPTPGARGPAVLVGHVDSDEGPAVFYRLSSVRPGDTVLVTRADGSRVAFTVTAVTVVERSAFPSRAIFAPTRRATIRLVTCTGPYDAAAGGYADSLVVWGRIAAS